MIETSARRYNTVFPTTFATAKGSRLWDVRGRSYIDFFAGAGALNLGHNHPRLLQAAVSYLQSGGILHALDMDTESREAFVRGFSCEILQPRALPHRLLLTAPTGSDAVEASLKIARRATGRSRLLAFHGGYHGATLGALEATSFAKVREAAGVNLQHADFLPFPTSEIEAEEVLALVGYVFSREPPACVIVEAVQAEGGVRISPRGWLPALAAECRRRGVVLILDEIQAGVFRTGPFFAFEAEAVQPDLILLSKSLSGLGLPFAVVLVHPDLDVLVPGELPGTFRGFQLAMVTANASIQLWTEERVFDRVARAEALVATALSGLAEQDRLVKVRGRGLMWGVETAVNRGTALSRACFERGLLVETAGQDDEVLKIVPPLTISESDLAKGLSIVADAITAA